MYDLLCSKIIGNSNTMGNILSPLSDEALNAKMSVINFTTHETDIHISSNEYTIARLKSIHDNCKSFGFALNMVNHIIVDSTGKVQNNYVTGNSNIPINVRECHPVTYPCYLSFEKENGKVFMYVNVCDLWISVNIRFKANWESDTIKLITTKIEGKLVDDTVTYNPLVV